MLGMLQQATASLEASQRSMLERVERIESVVHATRTAQQHAQREESERLLAALTVKLKDFERTLKVVRGGSPERWVQPA